MHKAKALRDYAAGADMTARGIMYYSVIAERFGMTVSDWRAWDLLRRHGPMTAGEFAEFTGLTPGGPTALIIRLERIGVLTRETARTDARKVIVRAQSKTSAKKLSALNAPMLNAIRNVYRSYTDQELSVIARFMTEVATTLRQETANLHASKLKQGKRGTSGVS
jgi:DNA-binding MarR family transcriptional regulator